MPAEVRVPEILAIPLFVKFWISELFCTVKFPLLFTPSEINWPTTEISLVFIMLYADVRLPPTLSVPSLIKPFEFPSSVIMPVTSRFPAIFIVPVSSFTRPLTSALLPAIRVPLFVKSFAFTSPSTLRTPEVVIFSVVIRLPVTFNFA